MIAIFDLDGVITSEQIYWASAGEALGKLLDHPADSREIPISLISQIKSMAINSNWDLAYVLYCCDKIARSQSGANPKPMPDAAFDEAELLNTIGAFVSHRGVALLQEIGAEADRCTSSNDGRYAYRGTEYKSVLSLCQETHERRLADGSNRHLELPAVPLDDLRRLLHKLQLQGVVMGVATGRTRSEAKGAMTQFGIEGLFEEARVVCYDDVIMVENQMAKDGVSVSLTKPHPFSVLRAACPELPAGDLLRDFAPLGSDVVYVGDTVSDVLAAKAAGALSVGVLTGIPDLGTLRKARAKELTLAGCDRVITSILDLPQVFAAFPMRKMVIC